MYKANWIAIYNILNWLIASTKLVAVYNYDVKQVDSYPFAKITVNDWIWDFLDTSINQLISNYKISVINQANTTANSEAIMRELVDNILIEFNKSTNITLGWIVERLKVTNINWWWAESNEPLRICEINIEILETL
jgi:hypothetical protein